MKKLLASLSVLLLFGITAVWFFGGDTAQLHNAKVLPKKQNVPNFTLNYAGGESMNLQSLQGQWDLLFFGFASCPDVCPTGLQDLSNIYTKMQAIDSETLPKITFISLDPQRDNLTELGDYVYFFNEHFSAATGALDQIDILTTALGVVNERVFNVDGKSIVIKQFEHVPEAIKNQYTINHSATLYLIDPDGKFVAYFLNQSDENEKVADDLLLIMRNGIESWRDEVLS